MKALQCPLETIERVCVPFRVRGSVPVSVSSARFLRVSAFACSVVLCRIDKQRAYLLVPAPRLRDVALRALGLEDLRACGEETEMNPKMGTR